MKQLKFNPNKLISRMTEEEMKVFVDFYENSGSMWQRIYWDKHQKILKILETVKKREVGI